MAVEIELKARLEDDFEPIRERLFTMGEYCRAYLKSDTYWLPASFNDGIPSGVRVRRESGVNADGAAFGSILVTYKTKEISDGIEVNDEREFTVSDAPVFEELLSRLGLRKTHRKEKKGWSWLVTSRASVTSGAEALEAPILAELSLVAGLGWFLEIEIQAANDSGQAVIEASRRRLLALLEKLEIPADRIEPRPYTVMLKEAG
jgi:adenylate cyclase class 2